MACRNAWPAGCREIGALGEGDPTRDGIGAGQIRVEKVCQILEQLVADGTLSNYTIGGATAAGFHGEPLATLDIDVFVFADPPSGSALVSLDPVYRQLGRLGFTTFENECVIVHGLPVQFLVASSELESEAVRESLSITWDNKNMRVMRPEHLAALALQTGRPKDRARVVYLLGLPQFDRALFASIVERHGMTPLWQRWSRELHLT